MKLHSESFSDQGPIPESLAFGKMDPDTHVSLSDNRSPHLAWGEVPEGARSFVMICHDPDVPSVGDDVNQEGRTVPASLPRVDFYHWVLVDIPAELRQLEEGRFSEAVSPGGKPGPEGPDGTRQGVNNYTDWFAGTEGMEGDYFGYDGPGPPWNDERLHHYVFTLYALDVARCPVEGRFGGAEALEAIEGHVLASASLTGTYTLNPKVAQG
uniref:Phospholipid-binding protein n=1 Tax=uncultured bacterium HF186_25m_27D22 TaxID=662889 RepID=C7FPK9_9BACT|nr:phospholipid-binding protein [uncultured bacterium HF186_25m_27D22]